MDDLIKRVANLETELSIRPYKNEFDMLRNHLQFLETHRVDLYDFTTLKNRVEALERNDCESEDLPIDMFDNFIDIYDKDKKHILNEITLLKSLHLKNQRFIVSSIVLTIIIVGILKYI